MPRGGNIAAQNLLKRAKKEAKHDKNASASLLDVASRSQTSHFDLSEPHANTDFHDIPCTPVAPTTPAAAEAFKISQSLELAMMRTCPGWVFQILIAFKAEN